MRRPTKVYIDGVCVEVEWDATMGQLSQGYGLAGDYRHSTSKPRIRVSHGMTRRQQQGTLLHELMHHIFRRSGLSRKIALKREEFILDSIDSWILEMLRTNPGLVEFLTEDN